MHQHLMFDVIVTLRNYSNFAKTVPTNLHGWNERLEYIGFKYIAYKQPGYK